MERLLPYNYDGSSCFMDSLWCALFFPNKLRVMDAYLLQGRRADVQCKTLCQVLRVVSKCVRGSRAGDLDSFTAIRPVISQCLTSLGAAPFDRGQHDPMDLFEALLRILNVGGVFVTKKTIQSQYHNGQQTTSVSTDQMFRHSVSHSSTTSGPVRFETLFPSIETLVLKDSQELVKQRTIIEFGGGPVLVITRDSFDLSVQYGRWSASTNAYLLPLLNTLEKCVQWYELQAVLCWKGCTGGVAGHYVCFVYNDSEDMWYFYNDLVQAAGVQQGFATLQKVRSPELHPEYPPSETGTMFIYAKVLSPPSDV